jgi:large subunit ribosomal protein L10Ae
MSKLNQETLKKAIHDINADRKKRGFVETVDLQVGIKDYDPQKDKRFAGSIKIPHVPRPKLRAIILGDQVHCDQAQAANIPFIDAEGLKKFNKDRKLMKKFFKPYAILLASESIIKQIPKLVGPALTKINKFPTAISPNENVVDKINEAMATIKFQLKKVLCLGVAVANLNMSEEEQRQNITLAINFLASLLKKNWNNIRTIHIKSTMGKSKRIFG